MIHIGICDDNEKDRISLHDLCKQHFAVNQMEYTITFFGSGEEVLEYCKFAENKRIDLLFLDIEMSGIDGIEVKNRILKQDQVWRIVFVSGYKEKVFDSFGLKTLGFVIKPADSEEIGKWIQIVHTELEEEIFVELKDSQNISGKFVRLEDIEYAKADGNYTDVYLHPAYGDEEKHILLLMKLGDLEKKLSDYPVLRVHKSYLINLMNVTAVDKTIKMRDLEREIPIGRVYRDIVRREYVEYGRRKVQRRL